jgi:hypothetical protein
LSQLGKFREERRNGIAPCHLRPGRFELAAEVVALGLNLGTALFERLPLLLVALVVGLSLAVELFAESAQLAKSLAQLGILLFELLGHSSRFFALIGQLPASFGQSAAPLFDFVRFQFEFAPDPVQIAE